VGVLGARRPSPLTPLPTGEENRITQRITIHDSPFTIHGFCRIAEKKTGSGFAARCVYELSMAAELFQRAGGELDARIGEVRSESFTAIQRAPARSHCRSFK
jgi:hypothetical protein